MMCVAFRFTDPADELTDCGSDARLARVESSGRDVRCCPLPNSPPPPPPTPPARGPSSMPPPCLAARGAPNHSPYRGLL